MGLPQRLFVAAVCKLQIVPRFRAAVDNEVKFFWRSWGLLVVRNGKRESGDGDGDGDGQGPYWKSITFRSAPVSGRASTCPCDPKVPSMRRNVSPKSPNLNDLDVGKTH
jgi:hypothetical protein